MSIQEEEGRTYEEKQLVVPMYPDSLSLFHDTPTNLVQDKISFHTITPSYMNVEGNNYVQFFIAGESSQFIDLSQSTLNVKLKIVDEDGEQFEQKFGERTAIQVDNVLHSLWKNVSIKLNNTLTSHCTSEYSYKAIFENLLFYNKNAKDYQTSSFGFFGESGDFSATNPASVPTNNGLYGRYQLMKGDRFISNVIAPPQNPETGEPESGESGGSGDGDPPPPKRTKFQDPQIVEFEGPLNADIWGVSRLIPNGVDLDVCLQPHSDDFRLITYPRGTRAKITIEKIYLKICKVDINPSVRLGINQNLEKKRVLKYPFKQTNIRSFSIGKGFYSATYDNLYEGFVPSKVVVGFVDSSAYNGNFNMNPFHFQHFDTACIGFYVDNVSYPAEPITCDIKEGHYLDAYMSLYDVAGKRSDNTDIGIDRTTYRQGYSLFGFNVDPTTCEDYTYKGRRKNGICKVDVRFKKPLPRNVTIIIYATFPDLIEIDLARVVHLRSKGRSSVYA